MRPGIKKGKGEALSELIDGNIYLLLIFLSILSSCVPVQRLVFV